MCLTGLIAINQYILTNLAQFGIKTHLVKRLNMREQLIRKAEIFPIEFIVRNIATGSLTKRLGISEGTVLEKPLLEYCYKKDVYDGWWKPSNNNKKRVMLCGTYPIGTSNGYSKVVYYISKYFDG